MDLLPIILNGAAVLLALVLIAASFVSRNMLFGRMVGGTPQRMTWFGRVFIFLAGSVGVYGFGLALLKQLHVPISPAWVGIAQPLSEVVLLVLFLSLAVPVLTVSVRDSWLRGKEQSRVERITSICMTLILLYLIWEATPTLVRKAVALFHAPK